MRKAIEMVHAVAMAGGAGTRFWPLSRREHPKQLLALFGPETLLAATLGRIAGHVPAERHWMVIGEAHAEASRRAAPSVGPERVLVEPRARNTAAAIALTALHVQARDPEAILAVFPADHHVRDAAALGEAVVLAAQAAQQGAIVTLGIHPSRPETGYGYVQRGEAGPTSGTYRVADFCEKPDSTTAESFLADGGYFWNAGIFVMRADTFLSEVSRQMPNHAAAFEELRETLGTESYRAVLEKIYARLESVSVDYGVMEGASNVLVVPVDCGWSDVGSLTALRDLNETDAGGNRTTGRALAIDCNNTLLWGDGKHVLVGIGLDDVIVAHSHDATLVAPASRAQDVRRAVERLSELEWEDVL